MKLSDLAGPDAAGWSDVAVFVRGDGSESEPFVVGETCGDQTHIDATWLALHLWPSTKIVRRLGRGRLVPARIAMEGEADLAAQVATLREALVAIAERWNQDRNDHAMYDACLYAVETAESALAATASKEAAK